MADVIGPDRDDDTAAFEGPACIVSNGGTRGRISLDDVVPGCATTGLGVCDGASV